MGAPGYRAPHESQWLTDLVNGCVSTLLLIHQVSFALLLAKVHCDSRNRLVLGAPYTANSPA